MKICIFSHARSGSSFLYNYLLNLYGGYGYSEIFENDKICFEEKYKFFDKESYVVKLMAHDFLVYDFEKIPWRSFDKIYITQRRNLADACASNYSMINLENNQIQPESFTIDNSWFIDWVKNYKLFLNLQKTLYEKYIITDHIFYEDISIHSIFSTASNLKTSIINYRLCCKNYNEIEKKLNKIFLDKANKVV